MATNKGYPRPPGQFLITYFPDEIITLIFESIGDDAIPYYKIHDGMSANPLINVRMTCRRFRNVSDGLLVPEIKVDFQSSSLDRLDAISRHPGVSKGVKRITMSLNFFNEQLCNDFTEFVSFNSMKLQDYAESEWGTREQTLNRAKWNVNRLSSVYQEVDRVYNSWLRIIGHSTLTLPKEEEDQAHQSLLQRAHGDYKVAYKEQAKLAHSGQFVATVAAALARMPRAKSLQISDTVPAYTKSPWNMPTGMTAMDANKYRLQHSELYFPALIQLPLAMSRAGVSLESFQIHVRGLTSYLPLKSNTETLAKLSSAFQRLETFNFHGWGYIERADVEHLTKFIGACLNTSTLKDVSLQPSGLPPRPQVFELPLTTLINPAIALDALTRVNLHEVICKGEKLAGLIRRLPRELELFELGHVRIKGDGTWEPIIDLLRDKTYADLTLHPLYGGETDDMEYATWVVFFDRPRDEDSRDLDLSVIERYVLGELEVNPLTSNRMGTWVDEDGIGGDDEDGDEDGEEMDGDEEDEDDENEDDEDDEGEDDDNSIDMEVGDIHDEEMNDQAVADDATMAGMGDDEADGEE